MATYLLLWLGGFSLLMVLAAASSFTPSVRISLLVAAVITLWLAWAIHGAHWFAEYLAARLTTAYGKEAEATTTLSHLGATGDLFGGVNALFSALAFGGLAIAAHLQFKTSRHARVQSFENSFYSSLELLHRAAEGVVFSPDFLKGQKFDLALAQLRMMSGLEATAAASPFRGREAFRVAVETIADKTYTWTKTTERYRVLQVEHNYAMGHYFRHLYQSLKLVDRQPNEVLSALEKTAYASVLRAQLSTSELALLLLNCSDNMVDQGEFRNLLVKYSMLEHLQYYFDGKYYRAKESQLILGDAATMRQFLEITPISSRRGGVALQGAFGSNPTQISR